MLPAARPSKRPMSFAQIQCCDVHPKVLMYLAEPSEVFPEYKHEPEYFDVRKTLFPHSNSIKLIGCGNGPPIVQEETLTCPACRLAESIWKQDRSKMRRD